MNKFQKMVSDEDTKRQTVLKILELLEGESYKDAKEILDATNYFLKENVYLDFNLARELISSIGTEK